MEALQRLVGPRAAAGALLLVETLGLLVIINRVAYTEIDWQAYMDEVAGFLQGQLDYSQLKGDTGPLVYPAGFVYIFSLLYGATDQGRDIRLAQYIFAVIYLAVLLTVLLIYMRCKSVPWPVWLLLCLSKRVHSIFVLRMFNDCVAVLLGYIAVHLFLRSKWRAGCFAYSAAVSVKMNMLLYAPGVLLVLLLGTGVRETIVCLSICAGLQLLLGLPFLATFPVQYISRSFDLGRVFMHKWTVNLKFLPEEIFVSKALSLGLLACTVFMLAVFATKWLRALRQPSQSKGLALIGIGSGESKLNPDFVVYTIFVSNFIGVAFARSLHYQFYSWYFHTLPFLLWHTRLPVIARLLIFGVIEVAFNVYPATPASSAGLQLAHMVLLAALYFAPVPPLLATQGQAKEDSQRRPKAD